MYATYEVNSRLSDLKIHAIIDKLNPNLRSIENFEGRMRVREFYAMSPEDAYAILAAIAEINGCEDKLKLLPPSEYDGKKWSLSALATMLTQSKWGVAGPRYFKYNGEWLNDIRRRLGV